MKKKLVLTAVAALLVVALTGCSYEYTVKKETVTESNGKTTTTTSITTNENGKITTSETVEVVEDTDAQNEQTVASIAFDNTTGVNIYGLYFSSALDENWGDNIFADDNPLEDGYKRTYDNAFRYSADNMLWDMKIEDSDGNNIQFKGLDMANAADPQNIVIVMTYDADTESYIARVE